MLVPWSKVARIVLVPGRKGARTVLGECLSRSMNLNWLEGPRTHGSHVDGWVGAPPVISIRC